MPGSHITIDIAGALPCFNNYARRPNLKNLILPQTIFETLLLATKETDLNPLQQS